MNRSRTKELAALDEVLATAERRAGKARDERRAADASELRRCATAELAAYVEAVSFRKRAPDPDEHRRLTLELVKRVEDDGLVFESLGRGGALQVVDPTIRNEYDAAHAAVLEAREARRAYAAEYAEEIEAEAKARTWRRSVQHSTGTTQPPESWRSGRARPRTSSRRRASRGRGRAH